MRLRSCGLVLTGLVAGGCGKTAADGPAAGDMPSATPVQVKIATPQKIADSNEYLSILKSRHSATINPQVEGYVTKILVKSGDHVTVGAPLLEIDPSKQRATLSSQEAARTAQQATVNYTQVQLERERKLFAAGVVPKQDLDNAQSTYDAAAAQLKSLQDQVTQQEVELHYYQVRSPMNGIVGDIPVREGDRVTVATQLTTVDEPGALEAYIYVPADRAKSLKTGLPVRLLDGQSSPIANTRITFVSPQVDSDTQTVLAKAVVENHAGNLRVAQQERAEVIWGMHDGIVIPILAVSRINGQFFAFLAVKDNKGTFARQKRILVGDTVGNDYVVLDGIHPGDHIILSGLQFLQDGAPVAEQVQGAAGTHAR